jgi:protease I
MNCLILTWENFQDQEVVYPYYRLLEETHNVKVMSNKIGKIFGIMGVNMNSHMQISDLDDGNIFNNMIRNTDILVLPGGVKALEKLRQERKVVDFITEFAKFKDKVIASTCHGAQLLISARLVRGKKIAGYYSIADDISNAGAEYSREPVVKDGNIISSPHYDYMGPWMKVTIDAFRNK